MSGGLDGHVYRGDRRQLQPLTDFHRPIERNKFSPAHRSRLLRPLLSTSVSHLKESNSIYFVIRSPLPILALEVGKKKKNQTNLNIGWEIET